MNWRTAKTADALWAKRLAIVVPSLLEFTKRKVGENYIEYTPTPFPTATVSDEFPLSWYETVSFFCHLWIFYMWILSQERGVKKVGVSCSPFGPIRHQLDAYLGLFNPEITNFDRLRFPLGKVDLQLPQCANNMDGLGTYYSSWMMQHKLEPSMQPCFETWLILKDKCKCSMLPTLENIRVCWLQTLQLSHMGSSVK